MRRLFLILLLTPTLLLAQTRRRAVTPPSEPAAPAAWLAIHASRLATTEAVGNVDDLAPLRAIVGDASVVALADGTHGTHEYFTSKLRIVDFLVTRMGFDTLAIEGTFPQMERVNAYVQGAPIDLRAAIFPRENETDYHFWAVEEFMAVADWMRVYNLTRGSAPAISVVGIDVWDGIPADAMAADYVARVDPSATRHDEQQLQANQAAYVARSSQRQFDDALHAATVARQSLSAQFPSERNHGMALNTDWARTHRSAAGRIVLWGHAEHFGKTIGVENVKNAGMWLDELLGSRYLTIGNAMWDGTYLGLSGVVATAPLMVIPVVAPDADSYEPFFHAAGMPAFLLSLHGQLHPFLTQPHHLRDAGFSVSNNWDFMTDLRKRFDAVVYVDLTTPTHPLPAP